MLLLLLLLLLLRRRPLPLSRLGRIGARRRSLAQPTWIVGLLLPWLTLSTRPPLTLEWGLALSLSLLLLVMRIRRVCARLRRCVTRWIPSLLRRRVTLLLRRISLLLRWWVSLLRWWVSLLRRRVSLLLRIARRSLTYLTGRRTVATRKRVRRWLLVFRRLKDRTKRVLCLSPPGYC